MIRISSGSKLGPHVYAFTSKFNIFNIFSCHKLWHYILQNKDNKRQIPSSLSIHLRNFQKMGVGVSLLGMVPVDYSVKNYRRTEKMKDKLLPLDKSHVQRVLKDKNPIPRDARNARKAVECHRG